MSSTSIQRLAPLTGMLGPLAVVVGLLTMNAPDASMSDAKIEHWFTTHGDTHWLLSAIAVAIGGMLMLVFTAVVSARQESVGAGSIGRHLTVVAGTAWGMLTLVGAAIYMSFPATHIYMSSQPPSAEIYRYVGGIFYGTLVMFCALAAALLAATLSVTSLHTGLLPRWLAVAGIPASVLMLANAMLPMAIITLWFGAVSISLARRGGASVRVEEPAPAHVFA